MMINSNTKSSYVNKPELVIISDDEDDVKFPPTAYKDQSPRVTVRKYDDNVTPCLIKNLDEGTCDFCYIDLKVGDGVMLQECLHVFCRECLQAAIESQKDVAKIPCPISDEKKCGGFVSDAEVKDLVSPEVFQEYVDRSLVVARKKMKNVFVCKTEHCGGWCEFDDGRKTFVCPVCNKTNCMQCGAIHEGMACDIYANLLQTGQHAKVNEIMKKERNNGWAQLTALMKAYGNCTNENGEDILDQANLLISVVEFECPICFENVRAGEGVILKECLHVFCRECLIGQIEHSDDPVVKCPYIDGNYSCICSLNPCEIKALVPNEIYEKHLERSVKLGESSIPNSFHCKTPDCVGWCEYDEGVTSFTCQNCGKTNCIVCQVIHEGLSCKDYKNRLVQNENEVKSEEAIEKLIKKGEYMRCPKCKIPVQKAIGCDWIQCSACRMEICWVTRGPRWGPKGYGDTSGGCRCRVNGKKCHPNCGNCH